MSTRDVDIVPLSAFGDPALLEPLARRIFGDADRPARWFTRKLRREAVDPALSVVAVRDGRPCGYALVGTPFSATARTAGVGVAPSERRRGAGRRLLEHAAHRASARGFHRLRTLAEPARVSFYAREGFVVCRTNHSLLNFATGDAEHLGPPAAWHEIGACIHEMASWMETAWRRTPASARATLRVPGVGTIHLSREGSAYLVHRLTSESTCDDAVIELAHTLLRALPRPRPVLLYGCNAVSSITSSLLRAGWSSAQTASVMERPL